jgi:uncharacterized membrane protein YcaP (DUF421 family)
MLDQLFNIDWQEIFVPTLPLLEIIIRGSLSYIILFVLIRLILQRESGTVRITNILVVVLVADALQNGMAGEYKSLTDGLLLVVVILFWAYFINWLGTRFPAVQRWINPPSLLLIKDGKLLHHNMRKELLTEDEIIAAMRHNGIEDIGQVKRAYMEGDGQFSFITHAS